MTSRRGWVLVVVGLVALAGGFALVLSQGDGTVYCGTYVPLPSRDVSSQPSICEQQVAAAVRSWRVAVGIGTVLSVAGLVAAAVGAAALTRRRSAPGAPEEPAGS